MVPFLKVKVSKLIDCMAPGMLERSGPSVRSATMLVQLPEG